MTYKDPEKKKEYMKTYSKDYYEKNKPKISKYGKSHREQMNRNYKKWSTKQQDVERRNKINLSSIYRTRQVYTDKSKGG